MPSKKLTKSLIDSLQPGSRDEIHWDTEVRGLQLKVTPRGKKVFFLYYRAKGATNAQRRYKLGDYGALTLSQAREMARKHLGSVAEGKDPSADRQLERLRLNSDRVSDLVAQFIEKHVSQNRSAAETERIFRNDILPAIGARSIHSIEKRDVIYLLERITERGAFTMANRALAAIRKFFNWCVARGIINKSPVAGATAPGKEKKRDRLLTDGELKHVLTTARQMGQQYGTIVQLLALTGQRREEVAGMQWDELDLSSQRWTIPAARSKNNKRHTVHLNALALQLLEAIPKTISSFVFTTNGRTPFQGFAKSKSAMDKSSGISDWRLHDLRRTVVSGMAALGVAPHVADKVLNHQSGTFSSTQAVYQQNEFLNERQQALDLWGTHVHRLLST